MSQSNEDTQVTHYGVSWFWAGLGKVEQPSGRVLRWAKGHANSQLEASRYVHCFVESFRRCMVPPHLGNQSTVEVGSFGLEVQAIDIFHKAARELGDDCPWIVPMQEGHGVLYAVGREPSLEELRELRCLAGLR